MGGASGGASSGSAPPMSPARLSVPRPVCSRQAEAGASRGGAASRARPISRQRSATASSSQRPAPVTATVKIQNSSAPPSSVGRSEEHTSELQSREKLVCRLLLEKKNTANP